MSNGKVIVFGKTEARLVTVSWKQDSSAAACISDSEAILIYPATGEIWDFSEKFNQTFRKPGEFSSPDIPPVWTPDGRYFLTNDLEEGGCMVCPRPWKVIPVSRLLLEHLSLNDDIKLYRENGRYPWLFQLPAAGWLRARINIDLGGEPIFPGSQVNLDAVDFAVNYEATQYDKLWRSDSPGGGWTITPDGKHAAIFNRSTYLTIRKVELPPISGIEK